MVLLHEALDVSVMTGIVALRVPEFSQIEKCKRNKHNSAFCVTKRKLSQNLKAGTSVHTSKEDAWLSYCNMHNH